jgi:hypothetical protein
MAGLFVIAMGMASPPARSQDASPPRVEGPAIVAPGETVRFTAPLTAGSSWTLTNSNGHVISGGIMQVAGGRRVATTSPLEPGYAEIHLQQADGTTAALAIAGVAVPVGKSQRFGVVTHFAQSWKLANIPLIARLGVSRIRDEQNWAAVEKRRGVYAPPAVFTNYMAALANAHIDPLIALTFGNPLYDGGVAPFTANGRAAYAAYATALLKQYGSQIKAVEVWNEYNGTYCKGPCRLDRPGTYAPMLATTTAALRKQRSDIVIGGGAAVGIPLPYFESLGQNGAFAHMDAAVIHPYRGAPDGVDTDIAALRQVMARFGAGSLAIWATEAGKAIADEADRSAQAIYLGQILTLLTAADVERIYWYAFQDTNVFPGSGLVRRAADPRGEFGPTPAFVAYATIIRELGQAKPAAREVTDPRTHVHRFTTPTAPMWVAWAIEASPGLTIDTDAPITVTTLSGATTTVTPVAGRIHLPLGPSPVVLHGQIRKIAEPRSDTLLADRRLDFDLVQGRNGWRYGMMVADSARKIPATAAFQPLQTVADEWATGWGTDAAKTIRILPTTMHPGVSSGRAAAAVQRWTSDFAGDATISGWAERGNAKGDGSRVEIRLNGVPSVVLDLPPNTNARQKFSQKVRLSRGQTVDIMLLPGPSTNVAYDSVGIEVSIRAAS